MLTILYAPGRIVVAEWLYFDEVEDGSWGRAEEDIEEPGRGVERGLGKSRGLEAEILAADILSDKRLIAIMLSLAEGPKTASELVSVKVYEKRKVKVRKRVRVDRGPYTPYEHREVEVEEEREDYHPLPQSTAYRLLKKLRELGLIEAYRGVDFRKRYYKLTRLGVKVAERVKQLLLKRLRGPAEKRDRSLVIDADKLKEEAKRIGVEPQVLVKALGFSKVKTSYGEYYKIPKT